ncbi:DUF932 domain-containing protein [Planotetraspora sp. GP83]|uniref:DUF932 domain-containing protein n=1 Tax=Planotetraspora sp. GP83 TaxID=3156264 RepID=UPI0035179F11
MARRSAEPNHYPGPVPVDDVKRRLFGWDALSRPIYVEDPITGGLVTVPERQAIVRSDTGHVMGIFSDAYQPHPYVEWLIGTIGRLLDDDLSIGSAGLLRNGAVAWVSVEVPDTITTPEGVEFRPHLLGATSFDGSLATTFKRVITNVICDNTMAAGLAERGQQVKIKHSRHSKLRLNEARDALNIVYQVADDFADQVKRLCDITVSPRQWAALLDELAPVPTEPGRSRSLAETKRQTMNPALASRRPRVPLGRHRLGRHPSRQYLRPPRADRPRRLPCRTQHAPRRDRRRRRPRPRDHPHAGEGARSARPARRRMILPPRTARRPCCGPYEM